MGITVNLKDPNLVKNVEAFNNLRRTGCYTDEQLQKLYDQQVAEDLKAQEQNRIQFTSTL